MDQDGLPAGIRRRLESLASSCRACLDPAALTTALTVKPLAPPPLQYTHASAPTYIAGVDRWPGLWGSTPRCDEGRARFPPAPPALAAAAPPPPRRRPPPAGRAPPRGPPLTSAHLRGSFPPAAPDQGRGFLPPRPLARSAGRGRAAAAAYR